MGSYGILELVQHWLTGHNTKCISGERYSVCPRYQSRNMVAYIPLQFLGPNSLPHAPQHTVTTCVMLTFLMTLPCIGTSIMRHKQCNSVMSGCKIWAITAANVCYCVEPSSHLNAQNVIVCASPCISGYELQTSHVLISIVLCSMKGIQLKCSLVYCSGKKSLLWSDALL